MANVWIFQGNPDQFNLDGYLGTNVNGAIFWSVRQEHLGNQMVPGDLVYIWRAGGSKRRESGIIASAVIAKEPAVQAEDPGALSFWKNLSQNDIQKPSLRVELKVQKLASSREMIDRNWLANDPILHDLPILKMAQNTNYLVPEAHRLRLKMLWARTGADWTREESLVGLWTYSQLIGKPVSETKDSLVAKSAVLIGRAVSGMYSKVQNFVSIDPRDTRKGLGAASEMDRQVWAEFFDPVKGQIRFEALEAEVVEKWGGFLDPESTGYVDQGELLVSKIESPNSFGRKSRNSRGQGFVSDVLVKKAIELRAISIATEYYQEKGFAVEDRGAYESFDLSCKKDNVERRAEVKGTTTDGATVLLTKNEVDHALSGDVPVDLIVVHKIEVLRSPDGPLAFGGQLIIFENWKPKLEHLTPISFTYRIQA